MTGNTSTVSWNRCEWCGAFWHDGMCPRVEEIEYHKNGQVKRVKLRASLPHVYQPYVWYPPTESPTITYTVSTPNTCSAQAN